jgi:hypothetical protein
MAIAPTPGFPERPARTTRSASPPVPSGPGPLYFEEGLGTDTDLPTTSNSARCRGTRPSRSGNHNQNVYTKTAQETMSERAHVGSLHGWRLGCFRTSLLECSRTSPSDYEEVFRSGGRQARPNAAVVND